MLRDAPHRRVLIVSGVLVLVGAVLAFVSWDHPPILTVSWPVGTLICVALLVLTQSARVHLEVRDQSLTVSPSDLAIVIGLVFVPVYWLIAAAILAATVLATRQRIPWQRQVFNLTLLVASIALAYSLATWWVHPEAGVLANALPLLAVTLVSSLTAGLAVLPVIWSGPGRTPPVHVAFMVTAMIVTSLISASLGVLAAYALAADSIAGYVLLALTAVGLSLAFLAYARLVREHANLGEVLKSVQVMSSARTTADLIIHLTEQASRLVRADQAQVWLPGVPSLEQTLPPQGSQAVVIPSDSRDARERRWLAQTGFRDALVMPIVVDRIEEGVLVVHDRDSQVATFTVNDLHLIQTLVTHAAMVWSNMNLVGRLRHEASHDLLTQLPNRAAFVEALDALIASSSGLRQDLTAAVLFIDLDRFKEVNDALGHTIGDRLLVQVARRLSEVGGRQGLLSRFGGDEFAMLVAAPTSPEDIESLASRLSECLVPPFTLGGSLIDVSASIGIAALFRDGQDSASLLRCADVAMSVAKRRDKSWTWYSSEDDRGSVERLNLVGQLRRAIDEDQIALEFQPQICLAESGVIGFEALSRWTHPERGPIAPEEFIPLADRTGQVGVLTMLAMRKALEECTRWDPRLSVSVNLPARLLLEPGLPTEIATLVDEVGIDPGRVVIELTEDSLMTYHRDTLAPLHALRDQGLRLSIDDFGTGYSSLAYLRRLPVQEIKIDKSFMVGVTSTPSAAALVRSIVDVGHVLGLQVVAEGVEDPATLSAVRHLSVDIAQGFHIARPMPAQHIAAWLATRSP